MAQLVFDGSNPRLHDHFTKFREELTVKLRDKAVETGRDTRPGDRVQGDRQQHVGEPDALSHRIATRWPRQTRRWWT
jgi:hypothetical protein